MVVSAISRIADKVIPPGIQNYGSFVVFKRLLKANVQHKVHKYLNRIPPGQVFVRSACNFQAIISR